MSVRMVVPILFLGCLVFNLRADERKDPIDAETIADFEKLGASRALVSFDRDADITKALRGFRFVELPEGKIPKLPQVKVPFGLDLSGTKLTDEGLKELKNHKNLNWLELKDTEVSDVGLKELKDLKNLIYLGLLHTKVTDAGLKELKDLDKLTHLNLYETKVTGSGQKELQEALPKCTIIWKTR
jgi:hypothetical protein